MLADLPGGIDGGWSSVQLCMLAQRVIEVTGASVMLMPGDLPSGSLCASDEVSGLLEELQFTLGEGPGVDAHHQGLVVAEPDLAGPGALRWPAFTEQAVRAGARAVFGIPMRVGAVRIGALNLYRDASGPLGVAQHGDAMLLADVITWWVLHMQAATAQGTVAEAVLEDADFHFVVHNAAGALSVQLGVSITDALVRIRAYAFGAERPVREIAEDIIARRLRF